MAIAKVIFNGDTLMDTTQKTVTAGSMLSGVTALKNDGTGVTGSITSQAAQTIHPSTSDQTIASGKYLSGTQTIKAVSLTNLTAGNIKKDVVVKVGDSTDDDCVTSVTGTYEGSGGTPNIQSLSVTQNGTYTASGNVDGYSPVVVNVSGGGGSATRKQINFIDYDGTILYSYTKAEIEAMTSESDLPSNPSHTGLTAQGWNWTLAQIKTQLTSAPDEDVWVGQMYITTSGKTEIDVTFADSARLSPELSVSVNGTISVDWGDNSTSDTITGSSLTTELYQSHTYANTGNYTISISVVSGNFSFYGSGTNTLLRKNSSSTQNYVYASCIKAIRIGTGITTIGNGAFTNCYSLTSVTIPNAVTTIENSMFTYCYSLISLTIPSGVTTIGNSAIYYCYSLKNVSVPGGLTKIGTYAFRYCSALASLTIPSGVTSIGINAFYGCYSIISLTIPSGVSTISNSTFQACASLSRITMSIRTASIGDYAFSGCYSLHSITIPISVSSFGTGAFSNCYSLTSITLPNSFTTVGKNAFSNCYSLASLTIPSGVTNIGQTAFSNCYGIKEYHILPTTVPSAGSTPFSSIVSDCVIYVPSAKLTDYQEATNWSSYASYMQGE